MIKQQKGFGVVEILAIIVVLGLLGGAGWYVWNTKQQANKQSKETAKTDASTESKSSDSTTPTTPPTTTDATANWLAYTSRNKKYSVSIPDGWKLDNTYEDNLDTWVYENIQYKSGTKATVTQKDGGRDGQYIAFHLIYDYGTAGNDASNPDIKVIKTYTTANKVEVTKSTYTQTTEPFEMGLPKGTVQYRYDLKSGAKSIRIVHDVITGATEQTKYIEQMVDTLKFL